MAVNEDKETGTGANKAKKPANAPETNVQTAAPAAGTELPAPLGEGVDNAKAGLQSPAPAGDEMDEMQKAQANRMWQNAKKAGIRKAQFLNMLDPEQRAFAEAHVRFGKKDQLPHADRVGDHPTRDELSGADIRKGGKKGKKGKGKNSEDFTKKELAQMGRFITPLHKIIRKSVGAAWAAKPKKAA